MSQYIQISKQPGTRTHGAGAPYYGGGEVMFVARHVVRPGTYLVEIETGTYPNMTVEDVTVEVTQADLDDAEAEMEATWAARAEMFRVAHEEASRIGGWVCGSCAAVHASDSGADNWGCQAPGCTY